MPKLTYKKYSPRAPETLIVIDHANEILEEYARQGLNLTLRQLYYQFVSRDLFPDEWADADGIKNRQQNYDRLGTIITKARDGGMIDWDYIVDRGREISEYPHYDDPTDFINKQMGRFFLDMWEDQPKRVHVWVEKDALSQVIQSAADPFDVPTFATKGYASASSLWSVGHKVFLEHAQREQQIVIIHLSDHDPSGINMGEDILTRMMQYCRRSEAEQLLCTVEVHRLALTMAQVNQFETDGTPLPPNPAKQTDPRFADYEAQFGATSWELDAIDPPTLVALITAAIEEHLDQDLYNARRELEQDYREQLRGVRDRWDDIVELLEE